MTDAALDTAFRPFTALRAVRQLMRDPEDTRQVFVIMNALRGNATRRLLHRFQASPSGARILAERRRLLDRLQDRAALAALPGGSLGRVYFTFMDGEQLTADGLVEASRARGRDGTPVVELLRDRMRDMHDLTHVITGYGRDGLGELCLLAFMFRQSHNPGAALIALMGMAKFPKGAPGRAARGALLQAFRNGGKAAWLPGQDWEALLARPLAEVRAELKIPVPTRYQQVQA